MTKMLVTLETDGLRDYVRFADGHRKILGPVSILKLIVKAAPIREARKALEAFNATGSCVITADLEAMEELMAPRRSRWAADPDSLTSPLMISTNRTSTRVEGFQTIMSHTQKLMEQLGQLEQTVTRLDKLAKEEGLIAPRLHQGLRTLAAGLHFYNPGDQSKNDAWYIDGTPKVDTVDGNTKLPESAMHASSAGKVQTAENVSTAPVNAPKPSTAPVYAPEPSTTPVYAPGTKMASEVAPAPVAAPAAPAVPSYDNLVSNTAIAEGVLSTVEETNQKIEALVTAGRKFNASKAHADLYAVASRTSEILANVDLAQPWVANDLLALQKTAQQIHGLFAKAKI